MDPILGTILLFAGNFAPAGWLFCQGQQLPINQNTALFSLLGTTYGGNGQTTFALPDLRGRVPIGTGAGPGLPNVTAGQMSGVPSVTLTMGNLPAHAHTFAQNVSGNPADQGSPVNGVPAVAAPKHPTDAFIATDVYASTGVTGTMPSQNTGVAGQGQPVSVMQPSAGLNYIIAIQGIFPSRP